MPPTKEGRKRVYVWKKGSMNDEWSDLHICYFATRKPWKCANAGKPNECLLQYERNRCECVCLRVQTHGVLSYLGSPPSSGVGIDQIKPCAETPIHPSLGSSIVSMASSPDSPIDSTAEAAVPAVSFPPAITLDGFSRRTSTNAAHPASSEFTSTVSVHGGERAGRPKISDSLTTPIVPTSTYTFRNTAELIAYQEGTYDSFEYGRLGNPTTQTAEKKISALEGAEETLLMASGMNAATTMLLALVPCGSHVITTTDCYRRTSEFIQDFLPKMGITASVIDPADLKSLECALNENKVSLFFSESPTNPSLRCIDIEAVSKLCHDKGALVCIDGTFATPINQKALALGADIVLQSATKYLAGHNDVLAGCISGSKHVIGTVRALHNILGGVLDPNAAYLIIRGMKTLHLRVKQQNETALKLAQALELHPKIIRVHYPGLESHPEHHIAKRQMSGFGGVISFEVDGDLETTSTFIDSLKVPYLAPSLGGVESLVEQPTIMSYWDQTPDERARVGIKDNLVRFSCGIENFEDIYEDFLQALEVI